jgi:hypothetical protein
MQRNIIMRAVPLALVLALSAAPCAAQQEYTHSIPGNTQLRTSTFSLWVPARPDSASLRGVLAVSDYESGREIYDDQRFRDWATQRGFVLLRYDMRNRNPTLFLAKEQAAVDRLFQEVLPHFATAAARPELAHLNVSYTGLSQAGWQAVALADLAPHRTIATLPIHDSTGERAPQQASVTTGLAVPSLHLVGRNDNVNMGSLANGNTYAQTIINFVAARRTAGALTAFTIQPNTGHTQWEGNEPHGVAIMIDWLSAVVDLRVASDPTLPPVPLSDTDGWATQVSITFGASLPWVTATSAQIQGFASVPLADRPTQFWLPSYGFATQWHQYTLSGLHIPYTPGCSTPPPGPDVNQDCRFDLDDLYEVTTTPVDVNRDAVADPTDISILRDWLRRNEHADLLRGRN